MELRHPPAAPCPPKQTTNRLGAAWQNGSMQPTPDNRRISAAGASCARSSILGQGGMLPLPAAVGVAVLVAVLAGCAGGPPLGQPGAGTPDTAASSEGPAAGAGAEAPVETEAPAGGTQAVNGPAMAAGAQAGISPATESVRKKVEEALAQLAAGSPKPETAQVTEVLTVAGISPAVLQVSPSRTPTGLEVDAIEAAVLEGTDCVIGQVREGTVTVTVLPVLASGRCFVGS